MTYTTLLGYKLDLEKDDRELDKVLDWASEAPDRRIHIVSKHTKKGELKWYVRLRGTKEVIRVRGYHERKYTYSDTISVFAVSPHLHIALQTALERWVKKEAAT